MSDRRADGRAPNARRAALAVEIDGQALDPADAQAIWQRFSDFMESGGDLAGFAAQEGVASVVTQIRAGAPTLIVRSK
jgi:hypothetical protein